jgi:hypothetical protein
MFTARFPIICDPEDSETMAEVESRIPRPRTFITLFPALRVGVEYQLFISCSSPTPS